MSERELEGASVMKPEEVDIGLNIERKKYKLFKSKSFNDLDGNANVDARIGSDSDADTDVDPNMYYRC